MVVISTVIIRPVLAQEGTMTISYHESGGYYPGDTFTFDGKNTFGNTTFMKISGPGLSFPEVRLMI